MLYDYILTQFYPSIVIYFSVSFLCIVAAISIYSTVEKETRDVYRKRFKIFLCCNISFLIFLFILPDKNYIKHYFGDVRQLTTQQKVAINQHLERQYKKSEKLFIDCLDKGQKQPNTTVFNDTNEVVKTCYKVARYKFN